MIYRKNIFPVNLYTSLVSMVNKLTNVDFPILTFIVYTCPALFFFFFFCNEERLISGLRLNILKELEDFDLKYFRRSHTKLLVLSVHFFFFFFAVAQTNWKYTHSLLITATTVGVRAIQ